MSKFIMTSLRIWDVMSSADISRPERSLQGKFCTSVRSAWIP